MSLHSVSIMAQRLSGTNVKTSFYIALNTGLRESEVFGLRWEDVDFEKKIIRTRVCSHKNKCADF